MSDGVKIHLLNRMANFFLVVDNDELTLIDTGNKDKVENIRARFEKLGHDLGQLKRIVITHSHFDHTGSLAALKEATGALVMAHEAEASYINHESRMPRPGGIGGFLFHLFEPLFRAPPVKVDVTLRDGDHIEGTGLEVIHTPGHTPGSICLYHAGAKALFAGDSIINRNRKLQGPITFFSLDIRQARKSVEKLIDLDIETIYFAHGPTMKRVAKDTLRSLYKSFSP